MPGTVSVMQVSQEKSFCLLFENNFLCGQCCSAVFFVFGSADFFVFEGADFFVFGGADFFVLGVADILVIGVADIFVFGGADILVIGGADFCVCLAGLDRSCRTAAVHPSPGGGGHQQLAQGSHLLQQVPPHPTY